jgi:DNA-binding transcriptional ArsR family regulator
VDADEHGTCRSCGAPVTWAQHLHTGNMMPLEPYDDKPVEPQPGQMFPEPRGAFVILPDGQCISAKIGDTGPRYQSHFATCPQADQWRNGSRPAAPPAARASDPGTSHEAAASVTAATVTGTRARILQVLAAARGPLTDEGIAERISARWPGEPYTPSGTRTRRSELEARGLVAVTDSEGRTAAGWRCRRYGLTALGVEEARTL